MADYVEIDEGKVAAVSDRGHRHRRNEDAVAVAVDGDRVAVVVCDGVSSTANPDQAAAAATAAAIDVLRSLLAPETAEGLMDGPAGAAGRRAAGIVAGVAQAVDAARAAVDDVPRDEPGGYSGAPSTTLVAVVVAGAAVVAAGVGDSRAYWLPTGGPVRKLTVDDSWAEAAIAAGVPEDTAYAAPQAHVITEWIGGDAGTGTPAVAVADLDGPGLLVVCSDGLWNYLPAAEDLASAVAGFSPPAPEATGRARPAPEATSRALAVARHLVQMALDAGGIDNVTVAVVEVGSGDGA